MQNHLKHSEYKTRYNNYPQSYHKTLGFNKSGLPADPKTDEADRTFCQYETLAIH